MHQAISKLRTVNLTQGEHEKIKVFVDTHLGWPEEFTEFRTRGSKSVLELFSERIGYVIIGLLKPNKNCRSIAYRMMQQYEKSCMINQIYTRDSTKSAGFSWETGPQW